MLLKSTCYSHTKALYNNKTTSTLSSNHSIAAPNNKKSQHQTKSKNQATTQQQQQQKQKHNNKNITTTTMTPRQFSTLYTAHDLHGQQERSGTSPKHHTRQDEALFQLRCCTHRAPYVPSHHQLHDSLHFPFRSKDDLLRGYNPVFSKS